jgi:MATE family, multidrug efflux pump
VTLRHHVAETGALTAPLPLRAVVGEVWRLAWPAICHQLLITMVFMADRALVGRVSPTALASLQISTTIAWTLLSLLAAVAIGCTALVSRLVGQGERREAALVVVVALRVAVVVGVAVSAVLLLADGALLSLVFPRVEPAVLADAEAYLLVALPVLPLALLECVAAAALQAAGDTRKPLVVATIGNVLNLALSIVLIFGLGPIPALGVTGAALGSAVAFGLQALLLLRALRGPRSPLPLREAAALPRAEARRVLRRLVSVTAPAAGERLVHHGGYLAFAAMIALLGATAMAANQALISVEALSYQTAEGFGVAAGALVGQRLGERRPERASLSLLAACGLAVLSLGLFSLLFLAAPRLLLGLFSDDPTVVAAGLEPLALAAATQPLMAFAVVAGMALRAAGATRTLLGTTLLCGVGVRLTVTWWLAIEHDMGLTGVWIGSTADWLVHALLLGAVLARGHWRRVVV